MMRFIILLAASAMMVGCTTVQDPYLTSSISTPTAPSVASEVSADYALALLPSVAGTVRSVRQQIQDHRIRQEIVYDNPTASEGENVLTIEVNRSGGSGAALRAPSEGQLQAEIRSSLPSLAMAISPVIGENSQGVYGYASGNYGTAGSCLYAWQFIKSLSDGEQSIFGGLASTGFSAQIRLRYCSAAIGPEAIALFMQGLRVKPINEQTFAVLKFAIGSNVASAPVPVAQPIPAAVGLVRAEAPVDASSEPEKAVRKTRAAKPAGVVLKNAAHVPLPGQTDNADVAAENHVVKKVGASVPLPSGS